MWRAPILLVVAILTLPSDALAKDRSKPPRTNGSPGEWFPQSSYPADAKRNGQQGRVTVQLAIDKTGAPTACTVITSSGVASLDKATCDLAMANGKFTPALDAKGQPTESTYALPGVRWELMGNQPIKLEGPWRVVATLRIDQAGKVASCSEQRSGPAPDDVRLCLASTLMPPAYGVFARGGSTAAVSEVTMESSLAFDGGTAFPMTYEADGRETFRMTVLHFDVDTGGKAGNCQVEAQSGPNPENICSTPPGPFLPIEKPRGITIKFAMSRPAAK